jgi:hypothetical protein
MVKGTAMRKRFAVLGGLALLASVSARAQAPPPVDGVTGTVAIEGTTKNIYTALNVIVVETMDGVEHVLHYTKDLLVHGGKGGEDALHGVAVGSTVVAHYTVAGPDATALEIDRIGETGFMTTEGTVASVDRKHHRITIKRANGSSQTLELTDRAADEAGRGMAGAAAPGARVIVYYADDAGRKVAHFFETVPEGTRR